MTNTTKRATAVLAGLFTAGLIMASPAIAGEHEKSACKGAGGCKGKSEAAATKIKKEKHACKGLNSCKGQGADGKNACKGHGSCATDGSTPKAK